MPSQQAQTWQHNSSQIHLGTLLAQQALKAEFEAAAKKQKPDHASSYYDVVVATLMSQAELMPLPPNSSKLTGQRRETFKSLLPQMIECSELTNSLRQITADIQSRGPMSDTVALHVESTLNDQLGKLSIIRNSLLQTVSSLLTEESQIQKLLANLKDQHKDSQQLPPDEDLISHIEKTIATRMKNTKLNMGASAAGAVSIMAIGLSVAGALGRGHTESAAAAANAGSVITIIGFAALFLVAKAYFNLKEKHMETPLTAKEQEGLLQKPEADIELQQAPPG